MWQLLGPSLYIVICCFTSHHLYLLGHQILYLKDGISLTTSLSHTYKSPHIYTQNMHGIFCAFHLRKIGGARGVCAWLMT